ncbi:Protein F58B4.3 a [Aphelenchoides avenae]|nr:Protein F58B4.3 a [Aphelenchus avenae]
MRPVVVAFALVVVGDSLRCYQGQQNASLPVLGSPMECLPGSSSCIFTLDPEYDSVTRACQIWNCTQNEVAVSHAVCRNDTSSGAPLKYCCCYGDGCNTEIEEMLKSGPAATGTNLAGSIAERIEDFYDHDASAPERTFLRRVVEHVYEHLDQ